MTNWPRGWLLSAPAGGRCPVRAGATAGYYSGLSGQWTHGEHQGTWKLFPSITSEPVERIEDCTADKVRISRILLQGGRQFRSAFAVIWTCSAFRFRIEEGAEEEVNGTFSFFLETARTPLKPEGIRGGTLLKKLCVFFL